MNTFILAEELAPLNTQIERAHARRASIQEQLHVVETELETHSVSRQRFDAVREVCNALDRLGPLGAGHLFWNGIPEAVDVSEHVGEVRNRIARFEDEIRHLLKEQETLKARIEDCNGELAGLHEEVRDAYEREERRKEEYVVEREISALPYRAMVMPWSGDDESEKRFRRAILIACLLCIVLGGPISWIHIPIPDRSVDVVEIPERLVRLVREEPLTYTPPPEAEPKRVEEKPVDEPEVAQADPQTPKEPDSPKREEKKPDTAPLAEAQAKPVDPGGDGGPASARKKAEAVGVLAFKDAFKDLMEETPVAKLGVEARLTREDPKIAGSAVPQRSLVAVQARAGSSGGISHAGVSRNIGNGNADRIGGIGIGSGGGTGTGIGIGKVSSHIAALQESARPSGDGPPPGRTDEEIQIVFDRYKASLYRIYNKELRRDPTLRGKMLMRIRIEPGGEVSMCEVESTDLASPELVGRIVERIKRFNFGSKDGVLAMTILYPIDFLPAG